MVGDWLTGAARGVRRHAGLTVGTGIGSAFLAEGRAVVEGPTVPPAGEVHRLTVTAPWKLVPERPGQRHRRLVYDSGHGGAAPMRLLSTRRPRLSASCGTAAKPGASESRWENPH